MIALFDADILVFRCGYAAEKNQWFLSIGGEAPTVYAYKKEAEAALDEALPGIYSRKEGEDYQLWSERYLEPVENALNNVKTVVAKVLSDLGLSDLDVKMYLSGSKNFRHDVAKTRPYKGNRDEKKRPQHEEAIRKYIRSTWDTTVCDGIEADDAMGIAQCAADPFETCIVTIDKDLDMIPGLHYNFVKEERYETNEEEAWRIFCTQLLMGDSTDNIPGLPRIGKAKAAGMLEALEHDELLEEVARQYASKSRRDDWFDYLTEQAQLIWILRETDTMFTIPEEYNDIGGDTGGEVNETLF